MTPVEQKDSGTLAVPVREKTIVEGRKGSKTI